MSRHRVEHHGTLGDCATAQEMILACPAPVSRDDWHVWDVAERILCQKVPQSQMGRAELVRQWLDGARSGEAGGLCFWPLERVIWAPFRWSGVPALVS